MKKLDFNQRKLCQIQGKIFEESVKRETCSSLIFIRRFMFSKLSESFDDFSILVSSLDINDCFNEIQNEYGISSYGKIKYSSNEMFWIGYIYRAISIIFYLPSREVYKLFNAREIVTYYNIYHTFDVEKAADKMMESINYHFPNLEKDAYKLFKKLMIREKLEKMIGESVDVYIDRPIGSTHPSHEDIVYPINYGYIKEITAADEEYQDIYLIGEDNPVKKSQGTVCAVIERENDFEDKLVINADDKIYSVEEIKKLVEFQEKNFKYKIVI